ncbi:putative membrane lipoprotein [Vibrio phage 249E41-1]|nr:putative membrane lipoprotein [Vibrio phage 249E41-1]
MKNLIIASTLPLLLVGCEKISPEYQYAAEELSKELCKGVVVNISHEKGVPNLGNFAPQRMHYTCISSNGSKLDNVLYKDVPIKYFSFEKEN